LLYALLVALKSSDANLVTPGQFVLMLLEVFGNLFRVVLVKEAYRANSCGARGSNRWLG
jgi:hypothetical protein|tara:strand:- start:2367 stop:2543 length:177 start_codon:yes stop_codon:yes gene_type:complete